MSISVTANRIHARKGVALEDIAEIGPDELLLRGCKPSTVSSGGILSPEAGAVGEVQTENKDFLIRACVLFEVVKLPVPEMMTRGNPLALKVGDVVLTRNALVDPLFGNELAITNLYLGVVGVAERAA